MTDDPTHLRRLLEAERERSAKLAIELAAIRAACWRRKRQAGRCCGDGEKAK